MIKNILFYKKCFLLITLAIIFIGSNVLAISNPGHSADEILITINNIPMTLQEAIDNEFLKDWATQPTQDIYTKTILKWHDANKITISIDGEKSLQETIDDTQISFCQDVNPWDLVRKLISNLGHFSDKIDVQFEGQPTTLQAMIDNSEFCSYSWKELGDWSDCSANPYWGSCSVSCGPGTKSCQSTSGTETQTVYCERSDTKNMGSNSNFCTESKPDLNQPCTESCSGSNTCNLGSCSPPTTSSNGKAKCSSWTHVSGTKWRCNTPKVSALYRWSGSTYSDHFVSSTSLSSRNCGSGEGVFKICSKKYSAWRANEYPWCKEYGAIAETRCPTRYYIQGVESVARLYEKALYQYAPCKNKWCGEYGGDICASITCKF
jgi:hypothetical protein